MPYSSEKYAFLFDNEEPISDRAYELLQHIGVSGYRVKTITSGKIKECEIYPIWKTQNELRRARRKTTRQAQRNLNDKNAKKKIIRKINANFTEEDICITLTYKGQVPDEEQARKDIRNYLRRVRSFRNRAGLDEIKYIYVIEFGTEEGKRKRVHHHVVMSGMNRDVAEMLWGKGWANARRLQPDDFGLEAIARYMVKESNGGKRWACSRNLVDPKVTVADKKISKKQVEKMAMDFEESAGQIFYKLFPKYVMNDCKVSYSDFVAGAYVYVRMRKEEKKVKGWQKRNHLESSAGAVTGFS